MALGIAHVHTQQVAGEQRRLVAARAGTNFQEHVALVVGVARQQRRLQFLFERRDSPLRGAALLVGKVAHRRIARHLDRGGKIALGDLVLVKSRDDRRQIGVLLGQRAITIKIARDVFGAQEPIEFRETKAQLIKLGAKRILHGHRAR